MALKIKSGAKLVKKSYTFFPKNSKQLYDIIQKKINETPTVIYVGDIDISGIEDKKLALAFAYESDLTEIKGLENWDTRHIEKMYQMFQQCTNLKRIDLSTWDVSNVMRFDGMFDGCSNLEYIGDISKWKINNKSNTTNMFKNCPITKHTEKLPQNYNFK